MKNLELINRLYRFKFYRVRCFIKLDSPNLFMPGNTSKDGKQVMTETRHMV